MRYKIINSDVYAGIYNTPNDFVDLAITSPPYWGQRDYGFEGQIGNEETYCEYIDKLTIIFSLLKDKLTSEGVFFLNIGDKYLSKYGKTSLGFIPYQLVSSMIKTGWILNNILMWYKPNHMPSSVKNRFSNSYEPVFVLSKTANNIYVRKNKSNKHSTILKINLQPTPYKHVAVFPEKLVAHLLKLVQLKSNATIMDPFAGSGTTLKVVKNYKSTLNAIMIENNENYIDIIKERSKLNGHIPIVKYNFIPYSHHYKIDHLQNQLSFFDKREEYEGDLKFNSNGGVKIFNSKEDYYEMLEYFISEKIRYKLNSNATCFIGSKDFDNDLICKTASINSHRWIIRNMVVIEDGSKWFPVFMIVDDNKKTDYIFQYKNLNLKSKTEYNRDWNSTDFTGYKVVSSIEKEKKDGKIVEILKKRENGFPESVVVFWKDGITSKEFVAFSQEEINNNIIIKKNFHILELNDITNIDNYFSNNNISHTVIALDEKSKESYNGKFKNEKRINWGASPGARSSVEKEFFSLQRLYEVDQSLVADYLNHKRVEKGFSKQDLTKQFPPNYKHTVGHWLRKDFGGSLPTKVDWYKLKEILDLDNNMTNYVCKTALKLQTVKNAEYKTPEDFININDITIFDELLRID